MNTKTLLQIKKKTKLYDTEFDLEDQEGCEMSCVECGEPFYGEEEFCPTCCKNKGQSLNFDKFIDETLIREARAKTVVKPLSTQRIYAQRYRHPVGERIRIGSK